MDLRADERPHGGARPPAAVFFASPDRRGERPLAHSGGLLRCVVADGYAGFNGLYEAGRVGGGLTEAGCWAHVRRKIFDVHAATGSALAAGAGADRGALRGRARPARQAARCPHPRAADPLEAAGRGAEGVCRDEPGPGAGPLRPGQGVALHAGTLPALMRAFDDGRLALDNNAAERALRCVAVGRKNYLFAGSELGAERAAAFYTLIETAKMNGLDPRVTCATCSRASPITRPSDWPICCLGTGCRQAGPSKRLTSCSVTERLRSRRWWMPRCRRRGADGPAGRRSSR